MSLSPSLWPFAAFNVWRPRAQMARRTRLRLVLRTLFGLSWATAAACAPAGPRVVTRAHQTMGAEVRVTAWTEDESSAHAAMSAVFDEFDRLDALLSVWRPGSDVLKVNAAAGRSPVRVSHETLEVLQVAQQVSEWTGGKFDVTFAALADVWKFDHDRDGRVPTPAEVAARLPLIDYTAVVIDAGAGTVFISRSGMRMHLGGVGKGYAIDRAVAMFRHAGLDNFMVQFGGDLFVSGRAPDGPWRLGINDPRGAPDDAFALLALHNSTFSTSGDYERAFLKDGERYHHILDPDTGAPARDCVSVTIVAKTAVLADALSTGVFILGPQAGMALVERLPDVEAVIVAATNDVLISSGLHGRVEIRHPPTPSRP